jgi:hypothetical protein
MLLKNKAKANGTKFPKEYIMNQILSYFILQNIVDKDGSTI